MRNYEKIKQDIEKQANKAKAEHFKHFFKTGKGEYGEGDIFLGLTVPEQRQIAKNFYKDIDFADTTMNYSMMQTVYTASLQTSAKILPMTILSYL